MLKKLLILFIVCLIPLLLASCTKSLLNNNVVCKTVNFDYSDKFNEHNTKQMLLFYCLCVDEKPCK